MVVNVEELKLKVLAVLNERGPSLPVHVARGIGVEPVLASAMLSELLNSKRLKLSHLKVGSSPLYLLPGHEEKLENFSSNLNHVEKEAYTKLKQNKLLDDEKQEPKIRVALRNIKDFAIPIQYKGKLFWKFFSLSNEKANESLATENEPVAIGEKVIGQQIWEDIEKEKEYEIKVKEFEEKKQKLIEQEEKLEQVKKELEELQLVKSKPSEKIKKIKLGEKFLNEVKDYLSKNNIELLSVESFNKKQVIAKIRIISIPENKYLLIAYDKKKISNTDIMSAYKKASKYKMPYYILNKGELTKKIKESIDAYKTLLKIDKL